MCRTLAALIPLYVASCQKNVTAITQALDTSDFETVTLLGHNLRGSGGGFGFQAITDLGAALVTAAENADHGEARLILTQLTDFLNGVEK